MILIRLRDAFETPSWKTEQTSSQSLQPVHFSGLIARTLPMGSINSLSFHHGRLVKNAPAYRRQASVALSGPLTISRACQELLLTRRNDTPRRCGVQSSTPHFSEFREPCICLPARSRFGEGRSIFEQPGEIFSALCDLHYSR
jgi:hypothetical protein